MAQLNDLIVTGASRLLNGLGVLGNANMDSVFPNITETYDLGSSDKKWKTGYIKSISANDMTLAILTVTNYATIGGGQAATAANTGALRVKGGLSTEQQSYFKGGAIFYGATDSSNRIYVFGDKTAQHISMGDASIQAYSNNTPTASKLYLQYNGGDLDVGKSGHTGVTTIYGPFNYAGFSAASDNVDRVVWFSYNGTIGRPVYDNDFKYNPSTNRLTLGRLYLTNTEALSHIQFSRVGYNYVITPSGGSIAFGVKGSTNGPGSSLVVQGNQVIPGENNGTIDLGAPDYAWKSLYVRDLYLDDGNGKQNAHTSYTNGTASTTEGTNGTQGYFNLYLGNSTAISSTAGSGAGNSRGRLYIYGTGAYSSLIQSSAASSSKTVTIPNYTGNMVIGNNDYTNPTSATTYYMPFYLTEHKRTSSNDGFRYRTLEGTIDAVGYGGIYLGNSVASGTVANKYGFIRLYAKNSDYTTILSQGNGDRNFYLPNYAGDMYAIHGGDNNAIGSTTLPVYVAANGRATACSTSLAVSVTGNAGTATKLKTARTIRTNLASTSTASFDGSGNITPGVTGTLGVGNGGTGATNALTAFYNLNYRGVATNANNNISIGNYYWATDCTNVPIASSYGLLYNFVSTGESYNNSSNWIWQLGFPTSAVDMYLRNKINDGAWSGWQKILHSGNYSSYCAPTSHTHNVTQISWGVTQNLVCTGTDSEWSIDMDSTAKNSYFHIWSGIKGNSCMKFENNTGLCRAPFGVYGGVWNDYAEYRNQIEEIEPGYCVASFDDGRVYKTSKKFQPCDGITSDTFGFAIGETEECKTPLAVAGRVLAYCTGDRNDYHSGDTVCAGPEGKVMKMTRDEILMWPDRIIGIVSEIPNYEVWGTGNVKVNGRIWIKVH